MEKLSINPRVLKLKESATLAINLKAKEMRANGSTVYHWGFGQSPFPVPECIQQELKNRTSHKEYLPTNGLPELRTTLSNFYLNNYELHYHEDQIFIGPGSKELIFQLIYILDAEYYIPAPSWVSYGPQVNLKGKEPHIIQTTIETNYKLTTDKLESLFSNKTTEQKVLILNSPSNPTGQFYSEQELQELTKIFRKYNVIVISDEIYHQVNFEQEITPTLAKFYPEGTIITGGLSKAQAAGGYRVGHMIIPKELSELISPLKSMISETFSAVAAPLQYAAIKGWDNNSDIKQFLAKTNKIHSYISEYFYHRFQKMSIITPKAQGAFYMFIDFSHYKEKLDKLGISTSSQLSQFLLEKIQVAVLPGSDFYCPDTSLNARIAFVDFSGEDLLENLKDDFSISEILNIAPHLKDGLDKLESFLNEL